MDRAMAESKTEVLLTRRPTGAPTFDPVTGDLVAPQPTTVYQGPCLLSPLGDRVGTEVRGGEDETSTRYQLSVPLSAERVKIGDETTVTVDPDPEFVGRKLWVSRVFYGSSVARRRCMAVDRVVAPR
jgi:hypothetical protein